VATIQDLFPTILKVTGLTHDGVVDGADISPALCGNELERESTFLMHFPHSHRSSYFTSYRKGPWKLVYHYHQPVGKRCELFNLAHDLDESDNLAESQPAELERMFKAMTVALEKAGAQYPRSKENPQAVLRPKLRQ
jgi:arylsulfatase A-like enzyme